MKWIEAIWLGFQILGFGIFPKKKSFYEAHSLSPVKFFHNGEWLFIPIPSEWIDSLTALGEKIEAEYGLTRNKFFGLSDNAKEVFRKDSLSVAKSRYLVADLSYPSAGVTMEIMIFVTLCFLNPFSGRKGLILARKDCYDEVKTYVSSMVKGFLCYFTWGSLRTIQYYSSEQEREDIVLAFFSE
jgi:hypothetical protein